MLLGSLLIGAASFADEVPDPNMIPDASVGQGGAQQSTEEADSSTTCFSDSDCDKGFTCEKAKCRWHQYRNATFVGCGGRALGLLVVGAVVAFGRRRPRT